MNNDEQLAWLIRFLAPEIRIPQTRADLWRLFRALVNTRAPGPISEEFLTVQDIFLKREVAKKGITDIDDLTPIKDNLYLWHGDITTLRVDAIVNAANSGLTGCYCPNHGCIDNAIHTFAGAQLRNECAMLMREQGYPEPTGRSKITAAYNLPSRYILHTVGPIVSEKLNVLHEKQLVSCYRSCLALAAQRQIGSVAFCCISTGEFRFPRARAAAIAIDAARNADTCIKIVFNVFSHEDENLYASLLTS